MKRRQFLTHAGATAFLAAKPLAAMAQSSPFSNVELRGSRSATDFGVLPDAPVDQSASFQAMLDSGAGNGMAVFIPAGLYVLSNIRIPSGTVITGIPGKSRLILGGTGPLLGALGGESITLDGLVLDGAGVQQNGADGLIEMQSVRSFRFEKCRILRATADAIHLRSCSGTITGCEIESAQRFGIFAIDSEGLSIRDNRIEKCLNGGVVIHRNNQGFDGSIVTGNRIADTGATNGGTGQWGNAINFFRADNVAATHNIISGSAFSAVRGNTVRGMQVTGNTCTANGETAIYAEFSFENAVISDNIVDSAANGISVTNFDKGGRAATVSGNIIRNLHATGPYEADVPGFGTGIGVEADAVVSGNLVEGAPLFGINAGWGTFLRDVAISGNVVRDVRYGIGVSAAEGAGRALIRGNVISAREIGIMAHAWGKPVTRDLLTNSGDAPPNVSLSGNVAG
ncbi:TIGR03808 family TAT-translocated repetitive protein [Oricola indica]|jgi:uncharacterized secreted repeat protein (TIGR03808 family)|uniref:TIGR03808 family TAT-translocated repetitive protein n=1 Tax=Oricola indica TaxID=2872591 RepID=UPI001CC080B6|nr:TIGR03808 family TAT-translocated repetitive protein [Oricola indica]